MKTKTMTFRLSEEDYKKLEELAKVTGLEKSSIIRYLVSQAYTKVVLKGGDILE